jgi:two-component system, NtrC family, nitrogen regulation response regulator GlnG
MGCGNVLIADDDAAIRASVNDALARAGYSPRATGDAATLWSWISQGDGDLVITDLIMLDENPFDLLPRIKHIRPELPVIVTSAGNTFQTAITAAERGASEYLPKPFDVKELVAVVGRALREPKRAHLQARRAPDGEERQLIGRSPAMREVCRALVRLMHTDFTVLITGETGTGKELAARVLHDYGERRNGPFVAVNMAAIPRELIEAELFVRFEQADGGTLFLDEIGDMPMETQTRLLQALEEGEYTPVGRRAPIRTGARILASASKRLDRQIALGLFREDLYYRLNVAPLRLPSLRERLDDIPDLIQHFLMQAEQSGLPRKTILPDALDCLKLYDWPGNVRELENLALRLTTLCAQDEIIADIIQTEIASMRPAVQGGRHAGWAGPTEWMQDHFAAYLASFGDAPPPAGLYHRVIKEIERPLIATALAATRGNQIRAAELLGVNRNTLRKKIREYDICTRR